MLKRILFIFMLLIFSNLCFSSEYVLVNKDESDPNNKYYGYQLEQSTAWKGIYISSNTSNSVGYTQNISTTSYSVWWAYKSTATYHAGWDYQKSSNAYPN